MEQLDSMKNKKIRLLEEEINYLSQQIETAALARAVEEKNENMDLD